MASRFILALALSIFFISHQVLSEFKSNEETKHGFNRLEERELVESVGAPAIAPSPMIPTQELNCTNLCTSRCSEHSRQNVCIRACRTCCVRCKCVPPGTYGNREVCGKCYTDMTTHGNQTKCP